jgi:hypothetical protein
MKFSKIVFCLSIFLTGITSIAYSQSNANVIRYEYPIQAEYQNSVYTYDSLKVTVLYYRNFEKRTRTFFENFEILNEQLQSIGSHQLGFKELKLVTTTYQYQHYLFFLSYIYHKGIIELHRLDLKTNELHSVYQGSMDKGAQNLSLRVINHHAYLINTFRSKKQVFVIDMANGTRQDYIPSEIDETLRYMEESQVVYKEEHPEELMLKFRVRNHPNHELIMLRFDKDGVCDQELYLIPKPEDEFKINEASLNKYNESYIAAGTFSKAKSSMANGLFLAKLTNNQYDFIHFYNFLDIPSLIERMSEREKNKLEKKQNMKANLGLEHFLNYNVLVHNIRQINGQYIFIGEFYYPTYRTVSRTSTSGTYTQQVFDGYQYTHALIAGFDAQGNLLWDNCFEMVLERKLFVAKKLVRGVFDNNTIQLVFANGSKIKSISFENGKVVQDQNVELIGTNDLDDEVKRNSETDITWWYDHYYVSYGQQVIKNKENERGDKKRKVFFINKLTY